MELGNKIQEGGFKTLESWIFKSSKKLLNATYIKTLLIYFFLRINMGIAIIY